MTDSVCREAFVLPPYPYATLGELHDLASQHEGGAVDLSTGTPTDPPSSAVIEALAASGAERSYPPSSGTPRFREAAAGWLERTFDVKVDPAYVAACIGTKEFVAGIPQWLRLRRPEATIVLHPELAYPSYEMGALLAGATARPVSESEWAEPVADLATDALCVWANTPSNPSGALEDLDARAAWGRANGVPVLSDECYAELTWNQAPRTVLAGGGDGVLAVHSLSKRSNMAGMRAGFYAGDPELVEYLSDIRRHAGLMVPGPVQTAAAIAFDDDEHATAQKGRYLHRLEFLAEALTKWGIPGITLPEGGFYLWVRNPSGDGWALAKRLADEGGVVVSPGYFYGEAGKAHVRIAAVAQDDRLDLVARRLIG